MCKQVYMPLCMYVYIFYFQKSYYKVLHKGHDVIVVQCNAKSCIETLTHLRQIAMLSQILFRLNVILVYKIILSLKYKPYFLKKLLM